MKWHNQGKAPVISCEDGCIHLQPWCWKAPQLNWNQPLLLRQAAGKLPRLLRPGLSHPCLANLISPWPFSKDGAAAHLDGETSHIQNSWCFASTSSWCFWATPWVCWFRDNVSRWGPGQPFPPTDIRHLCSIIHHSKCDQVHVSAQSRGWDLRPTPSVQLTSKA